MRINLNVKFEEKNYAKALGAKWDMARKVWFIVDIEDLTPFMRWIDRSKPHEPHKVSKGRAKAIEKRDTPVITYSAIKVPHCGCYHVLPWIDCEHTADYALDNEQQAHIKSIMVH